MTRKHFEAIAAAIKSEQTAIFTREETRRAIASNIADKMLEFNPNFDHDRFMKAAGF
jgi:hypothetical protein